jgi:hypothetical protein
VDRVIKFKHCAMFADLAQSEMVLGATPHPRHHTLLASYLLNLWRGPEVVREIIVGDIRAALDLGAPKRAADLLIVLRLFLSEYPEGRIMQYSPEQGRVEILSLHRRQKQANSAATVGGEKGAVAQRSHTARHELNRGRDHFSRARQTLCLPPERTKLRRPDKS